MLKFYSMVTKTAKESSLLHYTTPEQSNCYIIKIMQLKFTVYMGQYFPKLLEC